MTTDLPAIRRQLCHACRSSCQHGVMLTDVAVVVAEPVPAFELGVVSELFGLPRVDPDLPRYRYAVCAERRAALRTSTGFFVTPTDDIARLDDADLIVITGAAPPVPDPSPDLIAA